MEMIQSLHYKLYMMGIPLDGPGNVFCDNEAVVKNTTRPESTLKKKHAAICYHKIQEACAQGIIRIAKEHTDTNIADCLTKNLPGPKLRAMVQRFMY